MTFNGKNKVLILIIAILLVTNVVMLIFFLRAQREHHETKPKRIGFTDKLKNQVGFTEEQMSVYEPRKKTFWTGMNERFEKIKKTKEDFYYQIYDSSIPDSVIAAKAEQIGQQQKELDLHVFRHFRDIRKLCRPDQLQKYDSLMPAIVNRMTQRPGGK